jgi:two-component system, NarL family, response regulator LiaR
MKLTTIVADADPLARRLIKTVLQEAGITVIAEARDRTETIALALHYRPDVVLVDSVEVIRAIHERAPGQLIAVLARDEDEQLALAALEAGASGFLSKEAGIDMLAPAVTGMVAGEAAVSPRLVRCLIERMRLRPQGGGLRPVRGPLTSREWEIVDLLAPGRTTEEIADALVISSETVRSHVKNIMRKLDVHSRVDARRAAERLRLEAVPG